MSMNKDQQPIEHNVEKAAKQTTAHVPARPDFSVLDAIPRPQSIGGFESWAKEYAAQAHAEFRKWAKAYVEQGQDELQARVLEHSKQANRDMVASVDWHTTKVLSP